jgi:hypothetical protein
MRAGLLAVGLLAMGALPAMAQAREPVRLEQQGLKLEMAPLDADQVRAFFLARGFPAAETQHIAKTACLFRSAIGSSFDAKGAPETTVELTAWRVTATGINPSAPKVREEWETVWKTRGVPEDAATAFYWSLFPTVQTFSPTDYNWGFLTFGLPPGTAFDLTLAWRTGGIQHGSTIKGLQCAR